MTDRLTHVRAALAARDLPALLVSSPANRRYLSGFTGSYGWLLVTPTAALLFTDSRYTLRAAREAPTCIVRQVTNPEQPFPKLLAEAATALGLTRIACEATHLTVAEHHSLSEALGATCTLVPVTDLVEPLRALKDAAELALLRRAIAITDAAFTAVSERLTPTTTERQAAWMFELALRLGGADELAFPIIVAAGPNAAQPHALPGDEPLGRGRPIIIDLGARLGGYHADLSRTIVLGTPDAHFWTIYKLVAAAQRCVITGLRPGLLTHEADALARDHFVAAGYGAHFSHGLGHGVGLTIHEEPALRRTSTDTSKPLRPGMVTSVEPGLYLEDWGGVRIEDLVLITETGCEVLSRAPKLEAD